MQQYQVEMIAQTQFDYSVEESLLPMTPEQAAVQQSYGAESYGVDAYGQYYNAYETACWAPEYNAYDAFNTNELVCEEVQAVEKKTQTKGKKVKRDICQFWMKGCCERGVTCTFAHGEHQLGEEIIAAAIATCKWWMQGTCRVKNCKYAHYSTAAEGELIGDNLSQEISKVMAKECLVPKKQTKSTKNSKKNSKQSSWSVDSRLSNGSTVSQSSVLSSEAPVFQPQQDLTQFQKPQTAEEREQLMALLGNVMAALQ